MLSRRRLPVRSDSESRSAAASTAGACIRPGCRESRSRGPETETQRSPCPTASGPAPRPTPRPAPARRWTGPSPGGGCRTARSRSTRAFCRPRCIRSGSSQASSTWAAEPARMVSWEPTGMVSRRPVGRSAAATQTRYSPWRRHSWADSPVMSRSRARTGPAVASSRSSPAAAESSESRGPSTKRPCMSRATSRWCSSATARRCAVGRARPVPATRPASVAGPGLEGGEHQRRLVQHPDPAAAGRPTGGGRVCDGSCPYGNTAVSDHGTQGVQSSPSTMPGPSTRGARSRGTARRSEDGSDTVGEGVGGARRTARPGRAGPALHRPAPRARGDLPPGVRGTSARRPQRTAPRPDPGDRGPQRPDARLGQADR